MIRRFGLLGDVHAEDAALALALAWFDRERVDAVLSVGDLVDGAGDAQATIDLLLAHGVVAVRGNHDRWWVERKMLSLPDATPLDALDDRARAFLASLPPTRRIATSAGEVLLCHGIGDDDLARLRPDDGPHDLANNDALLRFLRAVDRSPPALVVGGHTHRPMIRRIGAVVFLNGGTLHRDDAPCASIVDLDGRVAQFHAIDVARGTVEPSLRLSLDDSPGDVWGQNF